MIIIYSMIPKRKRRTSDVVVSNLQSFPSPRPAWLHPLQLLQLHLEVEICFNSKHQSCITIFVLAVHDSSWLHLRRYAVSKQSKRLFFFAKKTPVHFVAEILGALKTLTHWPSRPCGVQIQWPLAFFLTTQAICISWLNLGSLGWLVATKTNNRKRSMVYGSYPLFHPKYYNHYSKPSISVHSEQVYIPLLISWLQHTAKKWAKWHHSWQDMSCNALPSWCKHRPNKTKKNRSTALLQPRSGPSGQDRFSWKFGCQASSTRIFVAETLKACDIGCSTYLDFPNLTTARAELNGITFCVVGWTAGFAILQVHGLLHPVVPFLIVRGRGAAACTITASIHGLQVLCGPTIAQACKILKVLGHKDSFRSCPNLTPTKAVLNAFALRQLQNTLALALVDAVGWNNVVVASVVVVGVVATACTRTFRTDYLPVPKPPIGTGRIQSSVADRTQLGG